MKIAVLLSGGVDSSAALALLKSQGHELTAFYLKIWLEDELAFLGDCPWDEDLAYVKAVCEQYDVPLEVVSLQRAYWDQVVAYTIAEVRAGRTPNPDILCNERVKFGAFLESIDASFERIASGHYAQIKLDADGIPHLLCSPDAIKDQTYFLAQLQPKSLARALFPIGHLTKDEVRAYAHDQNLPNKQRKDSQGLCFLGKLKFRDFIKYHVGESLGPIIEYESGRLLGEHKGFWFHTIGQRQGLGLGGGPWYVTHKDVAANRLFVSRNYYTDEKTRDTFTLGACNWLANVADQSQKLEVKIRHGAERYGCRLERCGDQTRVFLDGSDQGIAPGQFAVFYSGMRCLGSGVINGW
jgi:tRNA (5-methylaminomethyl-2-thiouridylate)-methyltransferase